MIATLHCTKNEVFQGGLLQDFFSFLRIWSHLLKKSFMENLIFCAVLLTRFHEFFYYCYSVSGQIFYRYLCVIFCLCMKKNGNLLRFSVLYFFAELFLSILYPEISSSFQLSAVLDCRLD